MASEADAWSPLSRRGVGLPGDVIYQSLSWKGGPRSAHPLVQQSPELSEHQARAGLKSEHLDSRFSEPRQDCTQSPQRTPGRCAARSATASARTGCCVPAGVGTGWDGMRRALAAVTHNPSGQPARPSTHLRRLPSAHNDQFAIFQAHQHMAALLGHRHTVDWHFHGQGRHSRQQSGAGR